MGDFYPAEIKIPKRFIKGAIADLIYDELPISKMELRKELRRKGSVFTFEDGDARDGQFAGLEEGLLKAGIPFERRTGCSGYSAPLTRIFRPKSACGKPRRDVCRANDEDGNAYYNAEGLKLLLRLKPADLKRRLRHNLAQVLLDQTSPLEAWETGEIVPFREPDYKVAKIAA